MLTRVGHRDFGNLVRVKPNLALAAFQDGGREPAKIHTWFGAKPEVGW